MGGPGPALGLEEMRLRAAVSALLGPGPSLPSSAPAILPHRIAFGEAEVSALQIPVQRGKNKCVNFEYQDFSAVAMGSKAELLLGCLNLQTHVLQLMLQFQSSDMQGASGKKEGLGHGRGEHTAGCSSCGIRAPHPRYLDTP